MSYTVDSDGDGLSDGQEVNVYHTDPNNPDTDGDGFSDGAEVKQGSNPLDATSIPSASTGAWKDYSVSLKMWSKDDDSLGVMFRYQDDNNYYRFSWDKQRAFRRLVKCENGIFTQLIQDNVPYVQGQVYQVKVVANGSTLAVWIDGVKIYAVTDTSFSEGPIALYAWADKGAYFDDVVVKDLHTGAVLLSDDFNDGSLSGWTIVDEAALTGPSQWSVVNGALVQLADVNSDANKPSYLAKLGTYALYASVARIPQSQMQVVSVDSEELVGEDGTADNVLDGRTDTIWHTEWYNSDPPPPHEVVIFLGGSHAVAGFRYLPRQDGSPNGTVAKYSFYVSADGVNWGQPVASGTFAADTTAKRVTFTAKVGKFIRFVALSEINGNPWTSAAELNVREVR